MNATPRVAFFTDCYHEVNGVALTSRMFERYAGETRRPFLCVHAGPSDILSCEDPLWMLQMKRSPLRFALDRDLQFDLLLWRRRNEVAEAVRRFRPDVVHITGPGDVGILGLLIAHTLKIPVAASWHTNIHEFAARRLDRALGLLPARPREAFCRAVETLVLACAVRYYRAARVLFAPNPELVDLLHARTRKPAFLMQRGVDTELFTPARRPPEPRPFTIGYAGRLTAEKGVRLLAEIEAALHAAGAANFRFLIVGAGSEEAWLREHVRRAIFTGLLRGEQLAEAYAGMDVFAFPSRTDTFGNVVLEAMASSVPVIATDAGGPKHLVSPGETGFIASDALDFASRIHELMADPALARRMGNKARHAAAARSWTAVFDAVYHAYESLLKAEPPALPGLLHHGGLEAC